MLVFSFDKLLSKIQRIVFKNVVYNFTFDQKFHIKDTRKLIAYVLSCYSKGIQVIIAGKVGSINRFCITEKAIFS